MTKTQILNQIRQVFRWPLFEQVIAGLTRGKSPDAFISRFPANHRQYPRDSIREVTRDGIHYRLDLSDAVDWYIYFGFRESSRLKLYSLVNPGDVVFDIGANVGDVTLHFAKLVGESGAVYSFEPDPVNFRRLSENISRNNFKNTHPVNMGLGNLPGKFKMALFRKDNRGMTRIVKDVPQLEEFTEVEVTTLDNFFKSKNLVKGVQLVKIDVEGYETFVLKGALEFINKFRPILFIELVDGHLKLQYSSAIELVKLIEGLGYEMRHSETGETVT